ncbi:hypothetical protein P7C70_g1643, partial [Phenoliferia sp. Uapishka_3]
MLRASPETLEAFQSHSLRPKYALIFVLWLIAPRTEPHLDPQTGVTSSIPSTSPHLVPPLVLGGTSQASSSDQAVESPLTPPYQRAATVESVKDEVAPSSSVMPVKGSTSQDATMSTWYTPPLSSPPPQRSFRPVRSAQPSKDETEQAKDALQYSLDLGEQPDFTGLVENKVQKEVKCAKAAAEALSSEECPNDSVAGYVPAHAPPSSSTSFPSNACPIDYRGRPLCPDATRTPLSLRKRSSELADATCEFGEWILSSLHAILLSTLKLRLSPFVLFLSILHILLGVQLAALILEDAIVRVGLSNPLPADFPRANTFMKRLSRMKWRFIAAWRRYWTHAATILGLGLMVASVTVECAAGPTTSGHDDVPFGRWVILTKLSAGGSPWEHAGRLGAYRGFLLFERSYFTDSSTASEAPPSELDSSFYYRSSNIPFLDNFVSTLFPHQLLLLSGRLIIAATSTSSPTYSNRTGHPLAYLASNRKHYINFHDLPVPLSRLPPALYQPPHFSTSCSLPHHTIEDISYRNLKDWDVENG